MIKRVFFDFGGCLDAPGIHSRTLFWEAFLAENLLPASSREQFQEAYTQADQRMMGNGEAASLSLAAFNRWNSQLIAQTLGLESKAKVDQAGDRVTRLMREYLAESRNALELFHKKYKLGVISNFTGNLEVILREYGLRDFFDTVTESYYAGHSKPDARIFQAALASQDFKPEECLYVGDNPVNDIEPAKKIGMRTALIHPPGKKRECAADYYIDDLRVLSSLIQSK